MFRVRAAIHLLLFGLLSGSCRPTADPTPPPEPAPVPAEPSYVETPAADSSDAAAPASGATGVVDEETFKRLHDLRKDESPKGNGTEVGIAGSLAYLSLPKGATPPIPAVVVIHEWWGLNQHIRHWADRLAAEGYAAIAVDLYGGKVATTPDEAMALMKSVDDVRARKILTAAHDFLRDDPRIFANRRGVIGWCFGGGWALQQAIMQPDLDAAVIYYGHPVTDRNKLARIHAKLLGVFGDKDQAIPPASVDAFVAALKSAGKTIEIYRYDAEHGFANPSSAHYDEEAAADAWGHVQAFLARNLDKK